MATPPSNPLALYILGWYCCHGDPRYCDAVLSPFLLGNMWLCCGMLSFTAVLYVVALILIHYIFLVNIVNIVSLEECTTVDVFHLVLQTCHFIELANIDLRTLNTVFIMYPGGARSYISVPWWCFAFLILQLDAILYWVICTLLPWSHHLPQR